MHGVYDQNYRTVWLPPKTRKRSRNSRAKITWICKTDQRSAAPNKMYRTPCQAHSASVPTLLARIQNGKSSLAQNIVNATQLASTTSRMCMRCRRSPRKRAASCSCQASLPWLRYWRDCSRK